MSKLFQRRTNAGQLFPSPVEGEQVDENPPVFAFIQEMGAGTYEVEVTDADGRVVFRQATQQCFVRPSQALAPGDYRWRLHHEADVSDWVHFSVSSHAVPFSVPDALSLLNSVPSVHPRHLFFTEDIPDILTAHQPELATLRRNVQCALADGLPQPPRFHEDATAPAYHEYFVRHRQFVDRNLIACALAWVLLGDVQARDHGIRLLVTICSWDPEGPCAVNGPWGDEIGLSHARCIPAALDLFWDSLSSQQRDLVIHALLCYGHQCQQRLEAINFMQNPGNSHAGRLPAYLGEMALCLKGVDTVPQTLLLQWLQYALDIYGGIFPFYGSSDGGWAEGVFYGTSYTKWFLPFFSAAYRFGGVAFWDRPFYQRYPRFLEHFVVPEQENYPFGDGYWCTVQSKEFPGFFAQNPYRIYAQRTGTPLLQRFERQTAAPELFELHLLDVFLPSLPSPSHCLAEPTQRAALFPKTGLLSLHTDPKNPHKDFALLARGSRYGSVSHQHADQGSFCLKYGGSTLISPSGYYGRCYKTPHHQLWTNTSQAHNTLLIDGQGQATWSADATAQVLSAIDHREFLTGEIDGSNAYPQVLSWRRTFTLSTTELIVEDQVCLHQSLPITWCLHTLSAPTIEGMGFRLRHHDIELLVQPQEGLPCPPSCTDRFSVSPEEGVPAGLTPDLPTQYHIQWQVPPAVQHSIRVSFALKA